MRRNDVIQYIQGCLQRTGRHRAAILVACGVMLAVSPAISYAFCFNPAVNYAARSNPYAVYAADLNGDGEPDLAVANEGSRDVSVLINNGDGTFAAAVNYEVGPHPHSVWAADLDGDGKSDLAVGDDFDMSVLKNNGDGTFAAPVHYAAGLSPRYVLAADLNGDGKPDLAAANVVSNDVSVLFNNGDGTFASAANYTVGSLPRSIFAADLDGDGDQDLAVANENSNNVSILFNNGHGTFASAINYGVGNQPVSVFAADLDGDGDQDLAVATYGSQSVSVLKNNGDGTFAMAVGYAAGHPGSVIAADLDGEGKLDLVGADPISNSVWVLKGNGDGTFAAAVNYGVGIVPYSVFAADLDGDGEQDLAVANIGGNVSVLINCTPPPANSIVVESKLLPGGATGQTITIRLTNAEAVKAVVVPLVVRSVSSGAFITSLGMDYGDRLASPTHLDARVRNQFATADGNCKEGLPGGFHTVSSDDGASHPVGASPAGMLFACVKLSGSDLPAGSDASGSLNLIVNVGGQAGAFEIDTTCTDAVNHLLFVAASDNHAIVPSFTKGIITVSNTIVTNLNDGGPGSLRAAIEFANSDPGPNAIGFTVEGPIELATPLPALSDASGGTAIRGFSAPGASAPVTPTVTLRNMIGHPAGLRIQSSNNRIEGLTIEWFDAGIAVTGATSQGNTITACRFYHNASPEIDLGNDGVTLNDPGDADAGPNTLLNYPDFDSVVESGPSMFAVYGTSAPSSRVELFLASEAGNLQFQPEVFRTHGPAYRLLGQTNAEVTGFFSFSGINEPQWSQVTATATDAAGNTSEFSENKVLTPDPLRVSAYSEPEALSRSVMSGSSGSPALQIIVFSPPDALGHVDSIGPSFNTFGSRASYDSTTDYNSGGLPDTRVRIASPDTGKYLIKYELVGDPGNYLTGIGVDGQAEVKSSVAGAAPGQIIAATFVLAPPVRGELTGDGVIDVFDVITSIDIVFSGAPSPSPLELVDVNCDGVPDVFDVIYLIEYAFSGGQQPCQ
jgi:hypothetical protein